MNISFDICHLNLDLGRAVTIRGLLFKGHSVDNFIWLLFSLLVYLLQGLYVHHTHLVCQDGVLRLKLLHRDQVGSNLLFIVIRIQVVILQCSFLIIFLIISVNFNKLSLIFLYRFKSSLLLLLDEVV